MPDELKLADASDVITCYRVFLRREPESDAVIDYQLSDKPTIWQLMRRFIESKEYEPTKVDDGCVGIWHRQDGREVHVEASAPVRAAILEHVEQIWSAYGADDPYYSVLANHPEYRSDSITTELTEQFYETGADGVNNLKLAFGRNRISADSRWHILDLGCGVGRIGEHFCREFEYYYGVDISSNHLAHALRRFRSLNVTNAKFLLLKAALESQIEFDLFYSMIVLQHNPPPVIYYLLDMFFKKLKPGGFAFFQLPCHLYGYRFDAQLYLAGQGKRDGMEMHALPQKYVFDVMYKHGLQPIEIWPLPVIGPIGISYVFFARKSG